MAKHYLRKLECIKLKKERNKNREIRVTKLLNKNKSIFHKEKKKRTTVDITVRKREK